MGKKMILECSKCGARNYSVPTSSNTSERFEIKKFCKSCNEHVIHKQAK